MRHPLEHTRKRIRQTVQVACLRPPTLPSFQSSRQRGRLCARGPIPAPYCHRGCQLRGKAPAAVAGLAGAGARARVQDRARARAHAARLSDAVTTDRRIALVAAATLIPRKTGCRSARQAHAPRHRHVYRHCLRSTSCLQRCPRRACLQCNKLRASCRHGRRPGCIEGASLCNGAPCRRHRLYKSMLTNTYSTRLVSPTYTITGGKNDVSPRVPPSLAVIAACAVDGADSASRPKSFSALLCERAPHTAPRDALVAPDGDRSVASLSSDAHPPLALLPGEARPRRHPGDRRAPSAQAPPHALSQGCPPAPPESAQPPTPPKVSPINPNAGSR